MTNRSKRSRPQRDHRLKPPRTQSRRASDSGKPAKRQDKESLILEAAPGYFSPPLNSGAFAAMVYRDIAAVLYGHIEHHELYKKAGHKNMVEYAVEKLGLSTKRNHMRFSRAGAAAWANYPEQCPGVLEWVADGLSPVALKIAEAMLRSQLGCSNEHEVVDQLAELAFPLFEMDAHVRRHQELRGAAEAA